MGGDVLSGGVVFALAAALWLAYLLPTWLRRREYLATERNAVRLQQTLRILAETAEVPREVRVEATAREVAVQQRILRKEEQRSLAEATARAEAEAALMRAEAAAVAASATVTAAPRVALAPDVARNRARRLRRVRAATSLVMLAGFAVFGYGAVAFVTAGSWPILAGGAALTASAVLVLSRLARAGRMRHGTTIASRTVVQAELFDHAEHDEAAAPTAQVTWTPQPLPKPLYLSRGSIAASAMASVDAAVQLRRAAARAEIEERAARLEPDVTPLRPRKVEPAPAATGRYAAMGVIDEVGDSSLDLDAVLRRRRAVG